MEVQCKKQRKTQFPGSNAGEASRAFSCSLFLSWPAHPQALKNLPANAEDKRDVGSIPGLGRSPEGGYDNPLQYSCLQNPMDRGAWWATALRVSKSQTRFK